MKNLLFVAIITLVALSSCQKRINVNGDSKNRYEMLVNKQWVISSKESNGVPVDIKTCERDNYYVFTTDGYGRWEEGANNCFNTGNSGGGNGGDTTNNNSNKEGTVIPTYTAFSWSMTGDQFSIYMKNFGVSGYNPEWNIENMDYTHLDVRSVEKVNGMLYVYNIHLIAK